MASVRHQQMQQIGLRDGVEPSVPAFVWQPAHDGRDEPGQNGWTRDQQAVCQTGGSAWRLRQFDDGYGDAVLREKNVSRRDRGQSHVVGRGDKPPQIVEKRNARERRRVEAVNSAFHRLRKAVPIENTRGKRVSKVKTLQKAIEYINGLQELLKIHGSFYSDHFEIQYRYNVDEYALNILENYNSEF